MKTMKKNNKTEREKGTSRTGGHQAEVVAGGDAKGLDEASVKVKPPVVQFAHFVGAGPRRTTVLGFVAEPLYRLPAAMVMHSVPCGACRVRYKPCGVWPWLGVGCARWSS